MANPCGLARWSDVTEPKYILWVPDCFFLTVNLQRDGDAPIQLFERITARARYLWVTGTVEPMDPIVHSHSDRTVAVVEKTDIPCPIYTAAA